MGTVRRLLGGSAATLGAYAAGRLLLRRPNGIPGPGIPEGELLGSCRGRPRTIRGPRASRLYTEWFEPDGCQGTVLFTHGWCVTEAIWHYQKEALRRGQHRVVTWDLPGHGHSTPLDRGHLTLDVAVDALARVIDAVPGNDVVLVGHSLGGVLSIGYLVAHRETARRRVRGLVLAATPLMHTARWSAGRWPGAGVQSNLIALGMQLAVENSLVDRWFAREAGSEDVRSPSYRVVATGFGPRPDPPAVRFVRDTAATVPPQVRADTFRAMRGFDLRPHLPDITTPALVLSGRHDRLVSPEESAELATLLPKSRHEEFAEAGHALFLERPEEFNRLVRMFAARRLRPRAASAPGSA